MGVKFDRVLEDFKGPFEVVKEDLLAPPAGKVLNGPAGYLLDCRSTESFKAVNRLLKAGIEVRRLKERVVKNGQIYPAGDFFIPMKMGEVFAAGTLGQSLEPVAKELGVTFSGVQDDPGPAAVVVKPPRIALWDRYGGSMPSGWTRWVLEQFEFPFTVVYPPELDRGDLRKKYDVILLPDGAFSRGGGGGRGGFGGMGDEPMGDPAAADARDDNLPPEYRGRRGSITPAKTIPQFKKFLDEGGTLLTFGSSAGIYESFNIPLTNHLVTIGADGQDVPLSRDTSYVPGSVIRTTITDPTNPLTYGLDKNVDVMFSTSPVYKLKPKATGVTVLAKYDGKKTLRSGWAWGEQYLDGGIAVAEAPVGKGKLVIFAPQVNFRGQTHGAFKFWFNGIFGASTGQ
jgi:hypothetical protein